MGSILLIHSIVLSRQRNSTHTMCLCAVLSGWVKSKGFKYRQKTVVHSSSENVRGSPALQTSLGKVWLQVWKSQKKFENRRSAYVGSVLFFLTVDHPPKCSLRHLAEVGITLKSCAKVILFLLLFQFRAWSLFHLLFWVVWSGAGEHILGWLLAYRKFNT